MLAALVKAERRLQVFRHRLLTWHHSDFGVYGAQVVLPQETGLIARLADALLVDEENGVPVVLDDMLGSSDPGRLERIGAMLSVAGQRARIIVLTCTPIDSDTSATQR